MATATFWCEPTDRVQLTLRRYVRQDGSATGWTCADGWHQATRPIGEAPARFTDDGYLAAISPDGYDGVDWPVECAAGCGYHFGVDDPRQVNQERIYRDAAGREWPQRELPPGAMWDGWWLPERWRGADGIALVIKLPDGHDWYVDSQASNCSRRCPWVDDAARARHPDHQHRDGYCDPGFEHHKCWVRTGDPRAANVTAGKDGPTCDAGAGSISSPQWHGFLTNGVLATSR